MTSLKMVPRTVIESWIVVIQGVFKFNGWLVVVDNTVFVIQVNDNQYSIFHVYSLDSIDQDQNSYIYHKAIGFSDDDVYAAYVAQQYVEDVWTRRFMVVKLSLQNYNISDLANVIQLEQVELDYSANNSVYFNTLVESEKNLIGIAQSVVFNVELEDEASLFQR